jgi:hypothetical protein
MEILTLEQRILVFLGHPTGVPSQPESALPRPLNPLLRQLYAEIAVLEADAGRIGRLPEHYPLHVRVVMKTLAALLPWYTRPLVQFSRQATVTLKAVAEILRESADSGQRPDQSGHLPHS